MGNEFIDGKLNRADFGRQYGESSAKTGMQWKILIACNEKGKALPNEPTWTTSKVAVEMFGFSGLTNLARHKDFQNKTINADQMKRVLGPFYKGNKDQGTKE